MLLTAVRSFLPVAIDAPVPAAKIHDYALCDLGALPDGTPLVPLALNDSGRICVEARGRRSESMVQSFIVENGTRVGAGWAFGQPPVRCLSNTGLFAGAAGTTLRTTRAWSDHLGAFGENLWPEAISFARGINSCGDIVGNVLFDAGEFVLSRAFVRSADGHARFLTPPHGGTTYAAAINDAGDIAFNATPLGAPLDDTRAWCLRDGCYHAITGLGGRRATATAITPEGRVVGHAITGRGDTRAFLWHEGRITDLETIDGAASEALGANDAGVVVGCVRLRDGKRRAFRWTPAAGMKRLDDEVKLPRGWSLTEARGINAHGEIIGVAEVRGRTRGFLLRPV